MLPRVRDIRRLGSCALDRCAVAAGHVDAYVEEGPHAWDHAAGGLVAREAGATMEVWTSVVGHDLVVCATSSATGREGPRRVPPELWKSGGNKAGVTCVHVWSAARKDQ
jgi:hypothetical protein